MRSFIPSTNDRYLFSFIFLFVHLSEVVAQKSIRGKIIDRASGEPVIGATVFIKETAKQSVSKIGGLFYFSITDGRPFVTLLVTSVGYEEKQILVSPGDTSIRIELVPSVATLQEVVYTASRTPETILRSPVTVEKLNQKAFADMAGVSFHDELRQIKGLDLVSTGLTFKQVNSRGFSSTFSWRFLQLIDDVDNVSPALGWSYANIFSPPELDIESVELIPGAASALYGPIAFTGLLNTRTKDPFKHPGLAIQIKTGLNHINESGVQPNAYRDFSLRYARKVNERVAYKFNITYNAGLDFFANDSTDVNSKVPTDERGNADPARDALNFYGDEIQKLIPGVGLVSRTGYRETEVANYHVGTLRTSAALIIKLKGQSELIIQENYNRGNSNFTGTSRFSLRNMQFLTSRIEWRGKNFFLRLYRQDEDMGDSYNTRTLSQLLNKRWVKDLSGQVVSADMADATWFSRYEAAFKGAVSTIPSNSHAAARAFADQGRFIPGNADFERAKYDIIHTYQGKGAAYFTRSSFYHVEGQYAFKNAFQKIDLLVGGNLRSYDLFTRGTFYSDSASNVRFSEYGMFLRANRDFFDQRLKLSASLRYDKNPGFRFNLSPRFSMVFEAGKDQFIRASYQTGFRNPTAIEQFVNFRIGQLTLVGGVPQNTLGQNIYKNAFTTASVEAFINAVSKSVALGATVDQAIEESRTILKLSDVAFIKPETQRTLELGYKGELFRRLIIDFNLDYSNYSRFSVNAYTTKPNSVVLNSDNSINIQAMKDLLNNQYQNYQLYTNSSKQAHALFFSGGISYYIHKNYLVSGNINFSRLYTAAGVNTNEVAPFNTPQWASNLSFSNANVGRRIGFKLNWHWQDAFDWYGTFNGNRPGRIKAFSLVDAQVNKKVSELLQLKLGATNLFNHRIAQTYGSPRLGAIYYVSFTWDSGIKAR